MDTDKTVIFGDSHHPYQDEKTCSLLLDFIYREKPNRIIADGDILDCYAISRFDKDAKRKIDLQDELDQTFLFLRDVREAAGKDCEIIYVEGNHEARVERYLNSTARELAMLRCLSLPELLELEDLNIKYTDGTQVGKFYIYHGSLVRQEAGYTAKAEFVKNGCSGITGHTHRDAKYTKRTRGGHYVWYENFCLCDLDAEYINGIANWTQGWSMLTSVGSRQYVEQIPVINHRYIWKGEEIK